MKLNILHLRIVFRLKQNVQKRISECRTYTDPHRSVMKRFLCTSNLRSCFFLFFFNRTLNRMSGRGGDVEIGMRKTSINSSQKALLEASDEDVNE